MLVVGLSSNWILPFEVMFGENEDKVMKAVAIPSVGSSCWHMFGPSERVKKSGLHVTHLFWLLLVTLLAGKSSCTLTSAAPTSPLPSPTTTAQTSVQYNLDVTVDVTGQKKEESEIKDWLVSVFQNMLESCVNPNYETTTATPNFKQTATSVTINNTTTSALESSNTTPNTTSVTLNNTTTSALESRSTTPNTTSVTLNNTTTSALESRSTTPDTTSVTLNNNTTTSALESRSTTPDTTSVTLRTTATTPVTSKINTIATDATPATSQSNRITTATSGLSTSPPKGQPPISATTQIRPTGFSPINAGGNPFSRQARSLRLVRESGSSVTQSSGISNNTATSLFQSIDISCDTNTSIIHTECRVQLQLVQAVPACCILRTLCAASNSSSDIHVVGKQVYRNNSQNACNSNPQEENCCTYTSPANTSCEAAAFVISQTNLTNNGPENSICNCSSYCSSTVAYYTLRMLIQNPLDAKNVSSLISQTLQQAQNCTSSATTSCPLFIIATAFENAIMVCENNQQNRQNCSVILQFSKEVSICDVATAMMNAFRSQDKISYDGLVNRAAICGNSSVYVSPLTTQFTQVNVKPANFCMATQEADIFTCQNENKVVVQLDEQCDQTQVTTPSPNVTTIQPNTTVTSMNVTTAATTTNGQQTNQTAESRASALLDMTRDMSKLNSSQVDWLVSQLESLLSGPNISLALGNISIHIVSNLLGASPEILANSSTRIIGIVDTVGLKLVLGNAAQTLLSPSLALSAKPAEGNNFQATFFSVLDPSDVQVLGIPRLTRSVTTGSTIPQGSVTLPSSLTQNLTSEQQRLVTRVQFNFYQKSTVFQDKSMGQRKLNSGILGASVSNLSITGLKDNVVISLRNTGPIPDNYVATCVFWDFTLNNGSGGWNPKGCVVQNSTDNETVCGCNHLTSFAILLDLSRESVTSPVQDTILTFITYIGCGISAIFLSITLLTYLAFDKVRKDIPSKILIQLCVALLLLNLVFLVDAWLALYTDAAGLCISTAWFLHYFLLVSFTWMGLEAVHMYNALVKVFNNYISHYMLKFSLVGWGVPMITVIIVIAIDKNNYGLVSYGKFTDGRSDDFCWLTNDIAFYVAVVAYFCVIFLFNFIMFIVVLVQLTRIKRQNPHNAQHRSALEDVRSVAGITVLLGLTWGFAFFAWGPVNLAFSYLFAIFNSLQGFFIFVFFCAVKESVRRQWRTYLCFGKMRIAENSEWSRTATQKTVKKPAGTQQKSINYSKSSKSNSSTSATSYLVSDSSEQSGGISSPFDDRVITADEDSGVDVVLNEINRQYRSQQAP